MRRKELAVHCGNRSRPPVAGILNWPIGQSWAFRIPVVLVEVIRLFNGLKAVGNPRPL